MTSKLMNQDLLNQLEQDSHPRDRDSILDKTMTSMGKTMSKQLGFTQGTKFSMHNLHQKTTTTKRQSRLPSVGSKDERYNADLKNATSKTGLKPNASKTTLNIMNVTFNSRPGVSNYIMHLIGTGTTDGEEIAQKNQLPPAGYR